MAEFRIQLPDINGAADPTSEILLSPRPSAVEYPVLQQTRHETNEGTVIQQPSSPSGLFKWIWHGYRPHMAIYSTLMGVIEPLRSRYRLMDGQTYPYVFLSEDYTQLFRSVTITSGDVTPAYGFFKVRVLAVSRQLRQNSQSSMVIYDSISLDFCLHDTSLDLG